MSLWRDSSLAYKTRLHFAFRKIVLISFFVVCTIALVQSNVLKNAIDEGVYSAIHAVLKNQYPDEPEKVQCMIDDFRRNHIADKFYTADIIANPEKLKSEIQPYVDASNAFCTVIVFFQTPLGIVAIVCLFLLAISIICCLIRCICC